MKDKRPEPMFFATTNQNKLREISGILGEKIEAISIELFEPQAIDVAEVVEEKAKDAFRKTGKIVMVEDTGLEIEAWGRLPGALIKWFLHSVGNRGILKMMKEEKNRKALARTAVGFYDGKTAHIFIGESKGKISPEIRGKSDFGWDPIFIPDGYGKSFAEMREEVKNKISMRAKAFGKLKNFFEK